MPPKKDSTTRAIKILGLYGTLIFSGQEYSLTRLAQILRCSKQTVLEMMNQIEMSRQAAIESEIRGNKRWYRAKRPRKRPNVTLDPASIQHLLLCRDMVWHLLPESMRDELTKTIHQTTVLLPDMEQREDATKTLASSLTKGSIDYTKHQVHIDTLLKAMTDNFVCRVSYQAPYNKKPSTYSIAPLRIIAYHESLYLKSWLVPDKGTAEPIFDDMRLAVHRLKEVKITQRKFHVPEKDKDHVVKTTFGVIDEGNFTVKVKVASESAIYINERQWSADQKIKQYKDGSLKLEFTATSEPEVIAWALSFGPYMEVLEPKELREEMRQRLEATLARY